MTDPAPSLAPFPSPVDLADLILNLFGSDGPRSVAVEPAGARHAIRVDGNDGYVTRATLPSALGNAVVARLAIIAELTLGSATTQLGRVRIALRDAGDASGTSRIGSELLLAVRTVEGGLSAEVHRMATTMAPRELSLGNDDELRDQLGRYRLKGELGRGGMGVVYLGEHVVLQKEVAIKVLYTTSLENPTLAAQFVVEARAACRAKHPGIVDVTDFGALSDGRAYIAMELVSGPTLATVLDEGGPLTPARVLVLSARIAEALYAASTRGVVHRDLTPSNIFVCEDDQPKIGDFGVAKLLDADDGKDDLTATTPVVGTAGYMSPEQGLGEAVDGRSDIYSLGCVMYRMVTGRVPFTGNSLYAILAQHINDAPPPMESPHGPVPEALSRVILRALAKSPSQRYQTAGEMLSELRPAPAVPE
jgi:tRNA A-37 threonylcarbamoyl transferase component Bud32